jgi:hypothetical protein
VPGDHAQHRRLAHDHGTGAGQRGHRLDHRNAGNAAQFLVVAQRQLQRPLHAAPFGQHQRGKGQRIKPLHVAGAAAI